MTEADLEARVLLLAPTGRDATLAARTLERAGVVTRSCLDMEAFVVELERGAAAGLLTEESLSPAARGQLTSLLERQPLWSDLPVILCARLPDSAAGRGRLAALAAGFGNCTLVDRPLHPEALVGAVRSALRARHRQYQSRELQRRLENAVRQREQFLATLSHELRNPLSAIRNAVQVLAPRVRPGAGTERPLAIIDRQSGHLGRLVDDLLDVARVTTGKVVLQRRALDLRAILENVRQQLAPAFEQQGLTLTYALGERAACVDGDPVRLEQIFSNLLTNALKYTPPGGQVGLALHLGAETVRVRVTDSGVGIAAESLPTIFDLFSQADRSLDRAQGGMGIGLTLVRSLTELHGGTVNATSDGLGRGSELTVLLPLVEEPKPVERPRVVTPAPRRHVLIVEDSPDNREMLQALLEYDGHRVEVASDGIEAVATATRSHPEVALIDIGLPGIDGYEVARRMRARLGMEIVLVALTGYGRPEDRQRSADAGFDRHLTKPPDLAELNAVLAGAAARESPAARTV
jgi:signal transduction histidine kinase/CheY-like chemotaxis protein